MISFSIEECNKIINLSNTFKPKHSSSLFKRNDFNYYYHVVLRNSNTQWIFDRLKEFLLDEYSKNKINEMQEIYLHRYLAGNEFAKHNDSTTHPDQILNIGVCLNESYDGGEFIAYNPLEILPKVTGTIYTMKSDRDHEVKKILGGERWSLILFLNKNDLQIGNSKLI
jgi:hypothetical protein